MEHDSKKLSNAYTELQKLIDNGKLTTERLDKLEADAEKAASPQTQGWSEPFDQARDALETGEAQDFFSVGSV